MINLNVEELNKLQRIDNRAYIYILQVSVLTACKFLRGKIDQDKHQFSRDMKNKLFFLKHSLQEMGNQLLKEIISKDIETNWAKALINCMNQINLNIDQIEKLKLNAIKNKIHEWDRN